jgi:hypothetical protein
MTASPPVGGTSTRWHRYRSAAPAVFVVSAALGSLAAGAALWAAATPVRLPLAAVGVVAVLAVLVGDRGPTSSWRIPRHWCSGGILRCAAVFGSLLGVGFLTAVASPGLYVLWSWAFASRSWSLAWPAFLAFGLGRGLPALAVRARLRSEPDVVVCSAQLAGVADRLWPLEAVALCLLAGAVLLG